jgi:hypothetical protein
VTHEVRALKLYGERNTGTNFVSQLVAVNLPVGLLRGTAPKWWTRMRPKSERLKDLYFLFTYPRNLGWKHAVAPNADELRRLFTARRGIGCVTVTKNPYAWLLSLHRRPYHNWSRPPEFLQFLETPWPTVRRERAPGPYASPIVMWNAKTAAYLAMGPAVLNLRYEDVLEDPPAAIGRIKDHFGLRTLGADFVNVTVSTKPDARTFDDYRTFYTGQEWRAQLSAAAVKVINRQLDPGLVARFGYRLEA